MHQMRLHRLPALALAAALVLAGCAARVAPASPGPVPGGSGGGEPVEGGTVTIAQFAAPAGTFNPWVTTDPHDRDVSSLIYEGLLRLTPDLAWAPNLAEGFTVSEDGLTITFRLKEGLVWSDGTPLTSADVRFTFERALHPEFPGPARAAAVPLAGARELLGSVEALRSQLAPQDPSQQEAGRTYLTREQFAAQAVALWEAWLQRGAIETPDERTVVFHLETPYAPALEVLGTGAILPRHVFEQVPVRAWATAEPTRQPSVASGPFVLVRHAPDGYTELVRNEHYHLGRPRVERVVFRVIDPEVAAGALQTGEVDAAGVGASQPDPRDLDSIRAAGTVDVWEAPDLQYQYLGLDLTHPFLAIKEVRQAIAHAIDRRALVDRLLAGHGTIMNTVFLPGHWAYDVAAINPYPYDPDRARELLAAAGFADADGDGVLEKDGKPFRVTMVYPGGTSNPVRQASAPFIQSYLAEVGIQVDLQPMDMQAMIAAIANRPDQAAPQYPMWLAGWSLTLDPSQAGLWGESDLYNFSRWNPDTVGEVYAQAQRLLDEGVRTYDPERRRAIYRQVGRIFNEYLPTVFLYAPNWVTAVNRRVRDVNRDIRGPLSNIHEWWIPQESQ